MTKRTGVHVEDRKKQRVIVVDDTAPLADMYAKKLSHHGYDTSTALSGKDLLSFLADHGTPDLLVLDVRLPDIDGLQLLTHLKENGFDAPVIIITGHASIHMAVDAMRLGAADFLVKPFQLEKLTESVGAALEAAGLRTKGLSVEPEEETTDPHAAAKPQDVPLPPSFGGFIGISPPMRVVYDVIENAAKSNATVFITGESGTGKEVCAQAIHRYSRRSKAPFVAINCAAIPRELLESELFGHVKGAFTGAVADREGAVSRAHGGTLFLDEIAEMAPDMQTKLLRFLQEMTYQKIGGNKVEKANVRIVCATNRDPLEEVRKGHLRQDLYYRLHVIPVRMPPLRHRKSDIIDLADYFLKLYAREESKNFRQFSPDAEQRLLACEWPGNVRQLQNIIRGIVVLHNHTYVLPDMLPADLSDRTIAPLAKMDDASPKHQAHVETSITPLWKIEKLAIEQAIARCEGNIPRAAALLEISPSTIYRKKMGWEGGDIHA